MDYVSITESIMSRRRFTDVSGKEVTEELLSRLSHPERGMRLIHIAGTNGKGSTAAFIGSILKAASFKVGIFTSPHLVDFRERIRINDEMISREDLIRIGRRVIGTPMSNEPTMFDLCLAIALLYFKEQECDYVILETGMGGRLDSTNGLVEIPVVSVITRIGLDHTEYLGDTLLKIASEKAGILKNGTRCVIAQNDAEAVKVIKQRCDELGVSNILSEEVSLPKGSILGLIGEYQKENAKNAVAAAGLLRSDWDISDSEYERILLKGLSDAIWPGRMQIVKEDPIVILDGAHNPQGIDALAKSLSSEWPGQRFIFVMGVLADKDYKDMVAPLVALSDHFYATSVSEAKRALSAEVLCEILARAGGKAEAIADPFLALERAIKDAKKSYGIVVACGSLYMIGELLEGLSGECK